MTTVVVVGGGFAGMLAATAVARHADEVVIIDSDVFPSSPQPRRGLPQGTQNHMLMAGGAEALDQLLPGTIARLRAAGAHKLSMGGDLLTLAAGTWLRRCEDESYVITCARQLLDHVVRDQVLRLPSIRLTQSAKAVGLTGDAERVTGVRVERDGGEETILADLVIDATGSRTKSPDWLAMLGLPTVREEYVDAKLAYASRVYAAPPLAAGGVPGVLIQAQPGTGGPGQGGAFMPQEDGRWMISLIGTGGGHPPTDDEGFLAFARNLPDPIFGALISMARPLSPIRGAHGLANRRRRFDRVRLPAGFLALGDSAMVVSPNYASGMSIAARGALLLRTQVKLLGISPGLGRKVQSQLVKLGTGPWKSAIAIDCRFLGAATNVKVRGSKMQYRMTRRYSRVAAENPVVLRAIYAVASLRGDQRILLAGAVIKSVLRGSRKPALTGQQAISQFPEIADLVSSVSAIQE